MLLDQTQTCDGTEDGQDRDHQGLSEGNSSPLSSITRGHPVWGYCRETLHAPQCEALEALAKQCVVFNCSPESLPRGQTSTSLLPPELISLREALGVGGLDEARTTEFPPPSGH